MVILRLTSFTESSGEIFPHQCAFLQNDLLIVSRVFLTPVSLHHIQVGLIEILTELEFKLTTQHLGSEALVLLLGIFRRALCPSDTRGRPCALYFPGVPCP
jgi:hypothetical protein